MSHGVDFNQYWGVRVAEIRHDCKAMSLALDLFWTEDSIPCRARVRFDGVSKCEFAAEKIFESEIVELVSMEGEEVNGGWRVVGELSNYEFTILCARVSEDRIPVSELER